MTLALKNSDFVNNKLYVSYGTRQQAVFTIVDEEFPGMNTLGRINRMTCIIRQLDSAGNVTGASLGSLIIGLGDQMVKVTSSDVTLLGKPMTHDNMESCVVTLTEL